MKYILSIDQSTQGTKALLFDERGRVTCKADKLHKQIITEKGFVEHNPEEIYCNVIAVCKEVISKSEIEPNDIKAMGISNQRETSVAWNKENGVPICNAVVWQCRRGEQICEEHRREGLDEYVKNTTGLPLSPYFPASKLQWIIDNIPDAIKLAKENKLAFGTIDSWLIYKLTKGKSHKTDYSNASRTQLFDIKKLRWDEKLCNSFKIPLSALPEAVMSDSIFGYTDLEGIFDNQIPICAVMGDSHAALFGQNCRAEGGIKATYGTGSSVMLNTGKKIIISKKGLATSLAWGMNGVINYVLEGNLNYTGAVISWLKDEVHLIDSAAETEELAIKANKTDEAFFVPAFTGLGAPYWKPDAKGCLTGITRTTGRNEIVKACLECIGYQITDLIKIMREESNEDIRVINVDGGPTSNKYLMRFQSDIADINVRIPELQELSALGVAFMAGIKMGIYDSNQIFEGIKYEEYSPSADNDLRNKKYEGWKKAVNQVIKV